MELRHLRYFVAVAESLHFGRAATKLRIAQPSLSHQIGQLEAELATSLLARNKRHVELTYAGRRFLLEAREIIALADRAAGHAKQLGGTHARLLRVGMAYCSDHLDITKLAGQFVARHQNVRVEMVTMPVPLQLAALLDDALDIGFVRPPINDPALNHEIVISQPLVVALPLKHPLRSRARIALADLANEPFVIPSRNRAPSLHAAVMKAFREAGCVSHLAHEADQLSVILGMVAAGAGVAIVPASARKIEPRRVAYKTPDPSLSCLEMAIAWRHGDKSTVLAEFVGSARRLISGSARKNDS
jgi:DNA-binding transcriptional LysR family regulator